MIYYVEDDANIRELTVYALKQAGLEARGFGDAEAFRTALRHLLPELILLDIMLPGVDGIEILHALKEDEETCHVPVMMLTAKGTEYDTVQGLDAGADDYLSKPFGMMEMVSRVKALIRRAGEPPAASNDILHCGTIAISSTAHTVEAGGVPVNLTLKEFALLRMLVMHAGQVLTRDQLLEDVWGMTYAGGTRTVDVHVQTLRQKLDAAAPGVDACIKTVRGVGYCARETVA